MGRHHHPTSLEYAHASHLLQQHLHIANLDDDDDDNYDRDAGGIHIRGKEAVPFLTTSGLDRDLLRAIWSVADPDGVGTLTQRSQFQTILRLISMAQSSLLPPTTTTTQLRDALDHFAGINLALPQFSGIDVPSGAFLLQHYKVPSKQQQRSKEEGDEVSMSFHSQPIERVSIDDAFRDLDDEGGGRPKQQQQQQRMLPSDDFGDFEDAFAVAGREGEVAEGFGQAVLQTTEPLAKDDHDDDFQTSTSSSSFGKFESTTNKPTSFLPKLDQTKNTSAFDDFLVNSLSDALFSKSSKPTTTTDHVVTTRDTKQDTFGTLEEELPTGGATPATNADESTTNESSQIDTVTPTPEPPTTTTPNDSDHDLFSFAEDHQPSIIPNTTERKRSVMSSQTGTSDRLSVFDSLIVDSSVSKKEEEEEDDFGAFTATAGEEFGAFADFEGGVEDATEETTNKKSSGNRQLQTEEEDDFGHFEKHAKTEETTEKDDDPFGRFDENHLLNETMDDDEQKEAAPPSITTTTPLPKKAIDNFPDHEPIQTPDSDDFGDFAAAAAAAHPTPSSPAKSESVEVVVDDPSKNLAKLLQSKPDDSSSSFQHLKAAMMQQQTDASSLDTMLVESLSQSLSEAFRKPKQQQQQHLEEQETKSSEFGNGSGENDNAGTDAVGETAHNQDDRFDAFGELTESTDTIPPLPLKEPSITTTTTAFGSSSTDPIDKLSAFDELVKADMSQTAASKGFADFGAFPNESKEPEQTTIASSPVDDGGFAAFGDFATTTTTTEDDDADSADKETQEDTTTRIEAPETEEDVIDPHDFADFQTVTTHLTDSQAKPSDGDDTVTKEEQDDSAAPTTKEESHERELNQSTSVTKPSASEEDTPIQDDDETKPEHPPTPSKDAHHVDDDWGDFEGINHPPTTDDKSSENAKQQQQHHDDLNLFHFDDDHPPPQQHPTKQPPAVSTNTVDLLDLQFAPPPSDEPHTSSSTDDHWSGFDVKTHSETEEEWGAFGDHGELAATTAVSEPAGGVSSLKNDSVLTPQEEEKGSTVILPEGWDTDRVSNCSLAELAELLLSMEILEEGIEAWQASQHESANPPSPTKLRQWRNAILHREPSHATLDQMRKELESMPMLPKQLRPDLWTDKENNDDFVKVFEQGVGANDDDNDAWLPIIEHAKIDLKGAIERQHRAKRCITLHRILTTQTRNPTLESNWIQLVSLIQNELSSALHLWNELSMSETLTPEHKHRIKSSDKFTVFVRGLRECVRLVRSVAATLMDLYCCLEQDFKTLSDKNLPIVKPIQDVERIWNEIRSQQTMDNTVEELESVAEIRTKAASLVRTGRMCRLTLLPMDDDVSENNTTMAEVEWGGRCFMACAANFWANKVSSEVVP